MKNALIILIAGLILGAVAYWGFTVSDGIKGVQISENGMWAMAAGLIMTLIVGVGLMALLFFSSRHGHDEVVHNLHKHDQDEDTHA